MTNLNDEITGKNSDSPEQTHSSQQTQENRPQDIEVIPVSLGHMAIIQFLRHFLNKAVK